MPPTDTSATQIMFPESSAAVTGNTSAAQNYSNQMCVLDKWINIY